MGEIIRRSEAIRRGVTPSEIRRFVRIGTWTRLSQGIYVPTASYERSDDRTRHAYRARAASANAVKESALSHVSAAVLHGLETWQLPLDAVHLTRNRTGGATTSTARVLHSSRFGEDEVVEIGGVRVLNVARTVVDLAATVPFEHAVIVGDHALRNGLVTAEELCVALERMGRHPGRARATRAVCFMNDRSDSVGESRSRVLMVREQLPIPRTQVDVFDATGKWLARVDFLLPDHGVIGAFDGRVEYRRDGVASTDAEDVVFREKLREDALRRAGWVVVRWTWADLQTPGEVVSRIREAIDLAARSAEPTGDWVVRKLAR